MPTCILLKADHDDRHDGTKLVWHHVPIAFLGRIVAFLIYVVASGRK